MVTLSTIAFGCVALIFIGGFFEDLFHQIRESYIGSQLGHVQIYRRGFNEHGKIKPYAYLIDHPQDVKAFVKTLGEVEFVTSRLQFSGLISTGDNAISFVGQGVEPENERVALFEETKNLRQFVKSKNNGLPVTVFGQGLAVDDVYQVILGKGLAETMKVSVDSPITVLTSTVHGSTNAFDMSVKGAFETAQKEFDDIFLRMPLATAQSLLDTQAVQSLVVKLYKTEDTTKVFKALQVMIRDKKLDLELTRWEDSADFYHKTVSLFGMFYWIMRIVIGTVVILGIFNTMNMSVLERISEIGTLMALGTRRGGVMKLFLFEGLVLGIIGGFLGCIAGVAVVSLASSVGIEMPPPPGATSHWLSTPAIIPSVIFSTFVLTVVVSGISSLTPALKASRLVITEALRYR